MDGSGRFFDRYSSEALKPVRTGLSDRKLSCRGGDAVPQGLGVADAIFDPGHELRDVDPHHLLDAGPKLVVEVTPRIAANRRTKIVERIRSRSRPIGTVSSVHSDRGQHAEKVPSV